jgi:hypothetical protein
MSLPTIAIRRALPLALFAAALSFSCARGPGGSIELPATPPLSGGLGWGLVKDAYVRLKESPSMNAKDLNHLRRGGVYRLEARGFGDAAASGGPSIKSELWFEIEADGVKGWALGSSIDVFSTERQAKRAASELR